VNYGIPRRVSFPIHDPRFTIHDPPSTTHVFSRHSPLTTHHSLVRTVGFEPTLSGFRNRRISRLSYVLNKKSQASRDAWLEVEWRNSQASQDQRITLRATGALTATGKRMRQKA
jgi:hypothetical protein